MAASPGDPYAVSGGGGEYRACSSPFVSVPSSPARDPSFHALVAGGFHSAPTSPLRGGPGAGDEYGCELGFDSDFDFSWQVPSPAVAAMSSADELFHNGQIRPMRLSSFLLRPQALPPLAGDVPAPHRPGPAKVAAAADERGRFRSLSVHRRSRSHSPFRPHCLSPSSPPAPVAAKSGDHPASRSSSSSSTASSSSSSASNHHRRWRFLKDLLHRSKSDGGNNHHPPPHSRPPPSPLKMNSSPAANKYGRRTRSSTHARLYEARRAEAKEMRRRTFLPYSQGLLLGCLRLSARSYGAMHGLAAAKSRA